MSKAHCQKATRTIRIRLEEDRDKELSTSNKLSSKPVEIVDKTSSQSGDLRYLYLQIQGKRKLIPAEVNS